MPVTSSYYPYSTSSSYRSRFTVSPERRVEDNGAQGSRSKSVAPDGFRLRRHKWSDFLNDDSSSYSNRSSNEPTTATPSSASSSRFQSNGYSTSKHEPYSNGTFNGSHNGSTHNGGVRRSYAAFDVAEWRLQRCQRRIASMDMASAFDRAQERHRWSARRWADRCQAEIQGKEETRKKTAVHHEDVFGERKRLQLEVLERTKRGEGGECHTDTPDRKRVQFVSSDPSQEALEAHRPKFDAFQGEKGENGDDATTDAEKSRRAKEGKGDCASERVSEDGEVDPNSAKELPTSSSIADTNVGYYRSRAAREAEEVARKAREEDKENQQNEQASCASSSLPPPPPPPPPSEPQRNSGNGDEGGRCYLLKEEISNKGGVVKDPGGNEESTASKEEEEEESGSSYTWTDCSTSSPSPTSEGGSDESDDEGKEKEKGDEEEEEKIVAEEEIGEEEEGAVNAGDLGRVIASPSPSLSRSEGGKEEERPPLETNGENSEGEQVEVGEGEMRQEEEDAVKVAEEEEEEKSEEEPSGVEDASEMEAEAEETGRGNAQISQADNKVTTTVASSCPSPPPSSQTLDGDKSKADTWENGSCQEDKKGDGVAVPISAEPSSNDGNSKSKRKVSTAMENGTSNSSNHRPLLRLAKPHPPKARDLSWLLDDDSGADNNMLDSMQATLRKWVESSRELRQPDPLEGIKGRSATSTFVGTRSTDPYPRIRDEVFSYRGERNFFGRPHGRGNAAFENGDRFAGEWRDGVREGQGILKRSQSCKSPDNMVSLEGPYVKDRLEGKGRVEYRNGDVLHAWFSAGTLHGFSKLYSKEGKLKQVGWYSNGVLSGTVWQFQEGGGCLMGEVDCTGHFIGDNIAFLFPDLKTALVGTFVKGAMVMAQTCFIQLVAVRNEVCQLKFTQPRGPIYEYDPGTRDSLCREPMLPDPYESQYCYVRPSRIKGAQEGLFARRVLPAGTVASFYNGVRMTSEEAEACKDDEWEANAYKILDLSEEEGVLDIPPQFVSMKKYQASLAHKANHSFEPNGKFILFQHPRFGPVPAIVTTTEVDKDCEITVSYDYSMDDAPPWYQELFAKRIIDQYKQSRTGWNF